MKSLCGNTKVDQLLQAPDLTGTVKYLVDRWRGMATLLRRYEAEVQKQEKQLAELRAQQLKCMGAVEVVESMLSEFEPPPTSAEVGKVEQSAPAAIALEKIRTMEKNRAIAMRGKECEAVGDTPSSPPDSPVVSIPRKET